MLELNIAMTITGTDVLSVIGTLIMGSIGIYLKMRSREIPYNSTRTNYFSDKMSCTNCAFENMFTNSSENEAILVDTPFMADTLNCRLNPFSREHTGLSKTENHYHVHGDMNMNIQQGSYNSSQELSSSSNITIDPKQVLNTVESQLKDLGLNDSDEFYAKSEIGAVKTLLESSNPNTSEINTRLESIKGIITNGAKAIPIMHSLISLIQMIQSALGT
ncbi:hypothetical protein DSECCO2_311970 [anaerobic digester metagenome]